jgi:hypothetical protein
MKVAILDDYQNVALRLADWSVSSLFAQKRRRRPLAGFGKKGASRRCKARRADYVRKWCHASAGY